MSAIKNVVFGNPGFDDPRGAVAAIIARWRPGDHIYASGAGLPPILYYARRKGLEFVSPRKPKYVTDEIESLPPIPKGRGRLWFIFFAPNENDFDQMVLEHFHERAALVDRARFEHYVVSAWRLTGPFANSGQPVAARGQ